MENIRIAMNRGAFDFLTKPINCQALQVTIEKTNQEFRQIKEALQTRDELVGLRRELQIAATIQRSLLPNERPEVADDRFDLFATVTPAREVGGDFYDYFRIDDRRFGFLVGDVSGKLTQPRRVRSSTRWRSPASMTPRILSSMGLALVVSIFWGSPRMYTPDTRSSVTSIRDPEHL